MKRSFTCVRPYISERGAERGGVSVASDIETEGRTEDQRSEGKSDKEDGEGHGEDGRAGDMIACCNAFEAWGHH